MLNLRLKQLRHKHNKHQIDIAEMLGIGRSTYSMYEIEKRQLDYETLIKLAQYYNVSVDYLIGRTDDPFYYPTMNKEEAEYITRTLDVYRELRNKYKE